MPAGRPPIYTDPKELDKKVDEYIELCKSGDQYPAITGMALHLGFSSKESLYVYKKKPEFMDPIKKGLSFIELHHEQSLNKKSCTGHIFALKNMGWADRTEVKQVNEVDEEQMEKRLRELGLL